jgi:pilus assembly protein CpaB
MLVVAVVIALLGAGLVFVYVQGLKNQTVADAADRRVLVATALIAPGETIDAAQAAGKVDFGKVPAETMVAGALTSTDSLQGQIALTAIYPNEQIIAAKFGTPGAQEDITIPKGKMAVSVQLTDPARVAGFVVPGSQVSVFASGTGVGTAETPAGEFTRLLLPDVQVIGVGQTTVMSTTTSETGGAQTTEAIPQTILTLALDLREAQQVLFASRPPGELAFGLRNDQSPAGKTVGITASNLFG